MGVYEHIREMGREPTPAPIPEVEPQETQETPETPLENQENDSN
jgi:hypothetical protein